MHANTQVSIIKFGASLSKLQIQGKQYNSKFAVYVPIIIRLSCMYVIHMYVMLAHYTIVIVHNSSNALAQIPG